MLCFFSVLFLALVMILRKGIEIERNYSINKLKQEVSYSLSDSVIEKLCKIKYGNFEKKQTHDILERIDRQSAEKICNVYACVVDTLSFSLDVAVIALYLVKNSALIGIFYGCTLFVVVFMNYKAMACMNEMFFEETPNERRIRYLEEQLSTKESVYELRMYNAIPFVLHELRQKNKNVLKERLARTVKSQKYCLLSDISKVLWIGSVFVFGYLCVTGNRMETGTWIVLLGMVSNVLSTVDRVSYEISGISENIVVGVCLKEFFALEEETPEEGTVEVGENGGRHSIEFKNVWYKYPDNEEYTLKNINLTVCSDEVNAIVGWNGAGKTTLIMLMCKLLEPTQGEIFFDGISMSRISRKVLSQIFSVVFQNFGRYWLSLRENVALGETSRMENGEEIQNSLDWVAMERRNMDLDTQLGKLSGSAVDLSGGQWQKLAIARAVFRGTDWMILDEPTASYDAAAEDRFYEKLHDKTRGKGCILITHRLPATIFADRILVLEKGEIVEVGSSRELLEKNGIYARMFAAQTSLYSDQPEEGRRGK